LPEPSRLLKNTHLLRCQAASPSWLRGTKSLLIRRDATPQDCPPDRQVKSIAGAFIWAFLSSLQKLNFSGGRV
jgi:hypothetical protein